MIVHLILNFVFSTNGFSFTNFFGNCENDTTSYLNVVKGFNLKRYVIDFVGDVRQLISDDKYIYLLSKKVDNSVYIFNIECKKFYSKFLEIDVEPEEIKYDEYKIDEEEENENSNEQNSKENKNSNKKKKKCIIF